jgi:hypothetical protein
MLCWLCVVRYRDNYRVKAFSRWGVPDRHIDTSVQLGKQCFNAVSTGVHREQIFPGEAGLLGNGLLSKFRLTIDEPENSVIFESSSMKSQGASLRTE